MASINDATENEDMNNPNMPHNVCKAMKIVQKSHAKTKGGWTAEEHERMCAKLRKLGVNVIVNHRNQTKPTLVEDVQIHPWKEDADGNLFNPWCSNKDGKDAGWGVHSFAPDGQGGGEIIDDDDFDDYESAFAHGEALAEKYGVPFRRRTLFMIG